MTQPIDRETAIALAEESQLLGCDLDGFEPAIERLCNLAIAHSRKDAEPVFCKVFPELPKPSGYRHMVPAYTDEEMYRYGESCIAKHSQEADKPSDKLTGCACRWDENDNRVATCVRHQGWLDVVEEWATTAKENQVVIDRLTSKRQEAEQNTNGTDYVPDREFDALIAELQSITEEARATDYHDALRKAALFLNLLKSKVHKYANDIVRLDAACAEQHAAYTSAHSRLNEADKLLQQSLEVWDNARGSIETLHQPVETMEAIRTYLEGK